MCAAHPVQLDIVEYLYEHRRHDLRFRRIFQVAWQGHLEVVKFLHTRDPKYSESVIGLAGILKWSNGCALE